MHSRARKTDAGGVTLRDRLRHGSTTAEGTDKAPTTAYVQYSDYWGKSLDTGAAWGTTDVNAVQAGVKHHA